MKIQENAYATFSSGGKNMTLLMLLFPLLSLCFFYWNTVRSTVDLWLNSDTYGHGLLVPFVILYLIWQKRELLSQHATTPQLWGLLCLFILSGLWLIGSITNIQLIERSSLIFLIPILIWTLLGNRKTWLIFFPLCYLLLAAPIWNILEQPLQNTTAIIAFKVLQLTGLPILLDEYYITIPEGLFIVEKACGGLRFFIAAAALGSLFAFLNFSSFKRQLLFFSVVIAASVILNWFRVVTIIWIGHISNMEHPLIEDHYSLGWWMFAGIMIPLFYLGSRFEEHACPTHQLNTSINPEQTNSTNKLFGVSIACCIILAIAPITLFMQKNSAQMAEQTEISLPTTLSPWLGPYPTSADWHPIFHGATSQVNKMYRRDENEISVYAANYTYQTQDVELINELNNVYDTTQGFKVTINSKSVTLRTEKRLSIIETHIKMSNGQNRIIWHWFRVAGHETANPLKAKLLELWKLTGGSTSSSVIAIKIDYDRDVADTNKVLEEFLVNNHEQINSAIAL